MNAKQKIKKNRFGGMTPRLHGHTKIVFTDKFGRESVKLDKDNLVTDAIQKIFESNFFGSIDYSYLMPAIKKTLGGVVLFENSLGSDPTDIWIPTSFDNPITAHAGQTVPASLADDITRGLPNSAASVALNNGYKLVWNFPETQGNGDIAAVGLCHSDFGDYALKNSDFKPLEVISNDSIKSVTWAADDERYKILNVYDAVNHYGYTLVNNSANVGREGQTVSGGSTDITYTVKRRKNQLLNNIAVDMSHYLGNTEDEETFTLTVSEVPGGYSNYGLPSIFIDNTNNLFWIGFGYGTNSVTGNKSYSAYAFNMTAFTDGAALTPIKTSNVTNIVAIGSNMPTQGMIQASPNGSIPAVFVGSQKYYFGIIEYDSANQEFVRNLNTSSELCNFSLGQRFSELMALGNYFLVRGNIATEFIKLFEVDEVNELINSYDISTDIPTISSFYQDPNNPIIGANQFSYSPVRFTMGKSGTAINKLYLATKNDLPATITKTAANSMRVEYTLTYV
jgi:hypothetical protein